MMIGLTEAELVAVITGTFAVVAGVPAVVAAVISARTRKENREQHGSGQRKVDTLSERIGHLHGAIHDGVIPKLDDVAGKVDEVAVKVTEHDVRIDQLEDSQ